MHIRRREIIILAVLAALFALWALYPKSSAASVTVTINGETAGTYLLSEPQELSFTGYDGYTLTMVIRDGEADVTVSSCPDHICRDHVPISRDGEQIVCLPARIVIRAESEDGGGVDAVTE